MIDYNGDRTLEAMIKFIDSDGTEVSGQVEEEIPEVRSLVLANLSVQFSICEDFTNSWWKFFDKLKFFSKEL